MSEEINVTKQKNWFKDLIDSLVIAFVIAMIIRTFLISAYKIPSESMLDTLLMGDHLLASKISYIVGKPKHGDVAIFEYPLEPEKDFIKRVIGVPGDKIRIENQQVYRNGLPLDEPYKITHSYEKDGDTIEEFTVPEGLYMMMGDNRGNSFDGRYWGFVPENSFKGKALVIYWSKEPGGSVRWGRLLNIIR